MTNTTNESEAMEVWLSVRMAHERAYEDTPGPIGARSRIIAADQAAARVIATALEARDARPIMKLADMKEIAASALQTACESDPADPEHPDTICITTGDFETIVRCAVENWAETNAARTILTKGKTHD